MGAESDDNKHRFFRKPNPFLWIATLLVVIYAVWCVVLLILTASGHLLDSRSVECGNSQEDHFTFPPKSEAGLLYLLSALSLLVCKVMLFEFWRRKGYYIKVLLGAPSILFVIMILSFVLFGKHKAQEIKEFEKRYLDLLPLTDTPGNTQNQSTDTACHFLNNVYRWQAEFKCCGLQGHQDWESSMPDSCLCEGLDNSSGCVGVGNGFVYEKPCLPTVLSIVDQRSSTFRTIVIIWITIAGVPVAFCVLCCFVHCYWQMEETCCYKLSVCIYKMRGGEEMVPVVFIRNNNNNQSEEGNGKDEEAKESSWDDGVVLNIDGDTNVEEERQKVAEEDWKETPVTFISLSELRRLQEELEPPPFLHKVQCSCILSRKLNDFYIILLEEGSPLLPSGAVLVDPNKATIRCSWAEGSHVFFFERTVWPRERMFDCQ